MKGSISLQKMKKELTFENFFGPVVQLNRMSDSGSEGHRFESCRGHSEGQPIWVDLFLLNE